jgi:hypothetical protein
MVEWQVDAADAEASAATPLPFASSSQWDVDQAGRFGVRPSHRPPRKPPARTCGRVAHSEPTAEPTMRGLKFMLALLLPGLSPLQTTDFLHGHGAEAPGKHEMFAAGEAVCAAMIEQ